MELSPSDLSKTFIMLELRNHVFSGNMDLAQYFVRCVSLKAIDNHSLSFICNYRKSVMKYGSSNDTAIVDVILKRRLTGIIMTTYMPTILLNIIGHSTKYFKSLYFEAKITVNLTVS